MKSGATDYQSHQSGIETLLTSGIGRTGRPTNRTNLELKRCSGRRRSGPGSYQSHQSGIETNHSGVYQPSDSDYQSHQSGIETTDIIGNAKSGGSTNRTNLELKLDELIEKQKESAYQSHQSGIETGVSPVDRVDMGLPIAPIWNWNSASAPTRRRLYKLPIAPIWNWNQKRFCWLVLMCGLPIAPIWNWNAVISYGLLWFSSSTNRTNLELKLDSDDPTGPGYILPIAPIWNWNSSPLRLSSAFCLSTNRTNRIETYHAEPPTVGFHQSHQSGIHDPDNAVTDAVAPLELKRSKISHFQRED